MPNTAASQNYDSGTQKVEFTMTITTVYTLVLSMYLPCKSHKEAYFDVVLPANYHPHVPILNTIPWEYSECDQEDQTSHQLQYYQRALQVYRKVFVC